MIKKQFTLYLENRPGLLAKVTRLLAMHKLNIEGISVMPFKTDSPLLVNSDRILPLPFTSEGMELIAWIQHQCI